jgi:hypothetical protein
VAETKRILKKAPVVGFFVNAVTWYATEDKAEATVEILTAGYGGSDSVVGKEEEMRAVYSAMYLPSLLGYGPRPELDSRMAPMTPEQVRALLSGPPLP